jgi:adenylate kinase family enzyme
MRVAILGYSGAGKTTLANALAGLLGVPAVVSLDDPALVLEAGATAILDGIPATLEELEKLDERAPAGAGIEHFLYLQVRQQVRVQRAAHGVVVAGDPAAARRRILYPAELETLRKQLESDDRLTTIDANGSRSEVLADVLDVLGIRF